jgi:hypothetical protein
VAKMNVGWSCEGIGTLILLGDGQTNGQSEELCRHAECTVIVLICQFWEGKRRGVLLLSEGKERRLCGG